VEDARRRKPGTAFARTTMEVSDGAANPARRSRISELGGHPWERERDRRRERDGDRMERE